MTTRETNPNFMNGVPELIILRLLRKHEMYGYEIVQEIHSQSKSVIALGEGVVYPVLHGLEQDRALKSRRIKVSGRRRIYYSLTKVGTKRLDALTKDWAKTRSAIQKILDGGRLGKATA